VRDVLSNTCHDRGIGTGVPTAWPLRSPDFNPLDFYLWRHLATVVYAAPVDIEEAYRIVDARQTIRNYPRISEPMRRSTLRRALSLMEDILSKRKGKVVPVLNLLSTTP
jgi:hypothetical protein